MKIKTFRKMPRHQKSLFFINLILCGIAKAVINLFPYKRIAPYFGNFCRMSIASTIPSREQIQRVIILRRSIQLAARYTPWDSSCLTQAMVAKFWCQRENIPYMFYIGFAKNSKKPLGEESHAWVTSGPIAITGDHSFHSHQVVMSYSNIIRPIRHVESTQARSKILTTRRRSKIRWISMFAGQTTKHHALFPVMLQLLQTDAMNDNDHCDQKIIDWASFYTLIIRHRIWHQVQQALSVVKINPPNVWSKQLTDYCQQDKQKIINTMVETARIARVLNEANIHYCVNKGVILNVLIYDSLDTRPCRDIDVWVSPAQYREAVAILVVLGYQKKLPVYELKNFKERYYMAHHHDMAFYHPIRKILVELHFSLADCGISFFLPTPAMLKRVDVFNISVQTLNDDYHLLYLMFHGAIHAWNRLRWLNDIVLFIGSNRCDLSNVMHLAKQLHCEHVVQQSLMLVSDLFGIHDEVLCQLIQNPDWRVKKLISLAKEFIAGEYVSTDGMSNISMFVKRRYYLVLLATGGRKTSTISKDLFKIDKLFPYMTFPDRLSFLYYAIYPAWVVKYIWKSL